MARTQTVADRHGGRRYHPPIGQTFDGGHVAPGVERSPDAEQYSGGG